jgi:hypothetical protein
LMLLCFALKVCYLLYLACIRDTVVTGVSLCVIELVC